MMQKFCLDQSTTQAGVLVQPARGKIIDKCSMSLRCRAGDNTTDGGNDKKGTLAQVIVGQT